MHHSQILTDSLGLKANAFHSYFRFHLEFVSELSTEQMEKKGLNLRRSFSLWSDVLYDFLLLVPFSRIYIYCLFLCTESSQNWIFTDMQCIIIVSRISWYKKGKKKSKGKGKIVDIKIASSMRHLLVGKITILS